jgi:predicted nucleic-acid-binding Zn-ribbon protein
MKMDKIDVSTAKQFIKTKAKGTSNPCPLCKVRDWGITDTVFALIELYQNHILDVRAGAYLPVIPITCNNCGITMLISAVKAGIIEAQNKEK